MNSEKSKILGIALVLVGGFWILDKLRIFNGDYLLFILGGILLATYFSKGGIKKYKNIKYLLPGLLLIIVNIIDTLDNMYWYKSISDTGDLIILASTFLVVYLAHSYRTKKYKTWTLNIAILLYILSTITLVCKYFELNFLDIFHYSSVWAILFIIIGLLILINGLDKKKIN